MDRRAWRAIVHGVANELDTTWWLKNNSTRRLKINPQSVGWRSYALRKFMGRRPGSLGWMYIHQKTSEGLSHMSRDTVSRTKEAVTPQAQWEDSTRTWPSCCLGGTADEGRFGEDGKMSWNHDLWSSLGGSWGKNHWEMWEELLSICHFITESKKYIYMSSEETQRADL